MDRAIVIVPNDEPVCLGCLQSLSSPTVNPKDNYFSEERSVCQECKFPMCGRNDCDQKKWHSKNECLALMKADAANKLFRRDSLNDECESKESGLSPAIRINQFYHVIAILRFILITQSTSDVLKEQLQMLTDHNESRFVVISNYLVDHF